MIVRCRLLLQTLWVSAFTLAVARGQGTDTAPSSAATIASATAAATLPVLPPLPDWNATASVNTGVGYKDNLLLSHADPEGSSFARGGFESFLWHLPHGRIDYFGALNGEGTRYFSNKTVDHEADVYGQFEWRYRVDDRFKFALDLQGYYLDQIFDVSDTDVQRVVAQLKVTGATLGPTLRWAPRRWFWIEMQGIGKRETYRDGLNNNHVGDGAVRLGWKPGSRFELSVAGDERSRHYDRRAQYSVSGRELTGTLLRVNEREGEVRADVTWDAAAAWKTRTRAGTLDYRDNGSGYFNFHQRRIEQELDWEKGDWSLHIEGGAKRFEFSVQTVGLGLNPPPRVKDEFNAQAHVERKLTERWTAFVEINWERSRCNDPIASYNMNEGLLGVRWNWEK